jgi:hypothetical protein
MKNTKQITVTLPIDLIEVAKLLRTDEESKYAGRTISNLCSVLLAERLSQIKKENLHHLINS